MCLFDLYLYRYVSVSSADKPYIFFIKTLHFLLLPQKFFSIHYALLIDYRFRFGFISQFTFDSFWRLSLVHVPFSWHIWCIYYRHSEVHDSPMISTFFPPWLLHEAVITNSHRDQGAKFNDNLYYKRVHKIITQWKWC